MLRCPAGPGWWLAAAGGRHYCGPASLNGCRSGAGWAGVGFPYPAASLLHSRPKPLALSGVWLCPLWPLLVAYRVPVAPVLSCTALALSRLALGRVGLLAFRLHLVPRCGTMSPAAWALVAGWQRVCWLHRVRPQRLRIDPAARAVSACSPSGAGRGAALARSGVEVARGGGPGVRPAGRDSFAVSLQILRGRAPSACSPSGCPAVLHRSRRGRSAGAPWARALPASGRRSLGPLRWRRWPRGCFSAGVCAFPNPAARCLHTRAKPLALWGRG